MANKNLFQSLFNRPRTVDTRNSHGAGAYAFTPEQALAQAAVTGCLSDTYYASASAQLADVLHVCRQVSPEFVAKAAVYARRNGHMKDMPALLVAYLSVDHQHLAERVFADVIDTGKMLRNYVQIVRSGVVGRRSFGSAPKRWIREWFASRTDEQVFRASIGQSPSLKDIIRMVHPRPQTESRRALYGYLLGRPYDFERLPESVRHYIAFKNGETTVLPNVSFQMLSAFELDSYAWQRIAREMTWQQTRMNLNTLARHDVFRDERIVRLVADRLRDPQAIARSRVLPYQLFAAYQNLATEVPTLVRDALNDAMEIALKNVPSVPGGVLVCPDVSGSMRSPVTGYRAGATSKMRCVDVAGLMAAAFLRANGDSAVLPFERKVVDVKLSRDASVLSNAAKLSAVGGGGTNVSAALREANARFLDQKLVVIFSDNESWIDARHGGATQLMAEWERYRRRVRGARLVCLDVVPNRQAPAYERDDILLIGGFSDHVFEVIARFAERGKTSFVADVRATQLPSGAQKEAS